jgi:hypothetical protein
MASLPLSRRTSPAHAEVMEIATLIFFVLIALAAAFGLTADSRDSADWKPTVDGTRAPGWH